MINNIQPFILPALFLVLMYFVIIKPQKKREKAIKDLRSSLKVGDKVVTIGGIKGKVVKLKEEDVVIEVAPDKTRAEFKKWAIGTVEKESTKETETKEIETKEEVKVEEEKKEV